ncbi:prepilin peptidase [Paenibacillus polygoni]|uniref:Prepilin peptidase n=1 Tax=Paenibacillus polygoni TaxID=3050112 RepID=A0ABY8X6S4_9BACL|nr:prepilin peptidase [Paenibacillus polygoni]WIV20172.1 prepilin peptidase [Paenibacillus polygoni]
MKEVNVMELVYYGCGIFVVAAFITDVSSMRIPNLLSLSAIISGLIVHLCIGGFQGLLSSMSGLSTGFGIMFVLYLAGAVGAGDVKIFGGIGAWTGVLFTVQAMVYSILIAGIIGLAILLWKKQLVQRLGKLILYIFSRVIPSIGFMSPVQSYSPLKEGLRFPFMIAVLPGFISACGIYLL